MQRNWLFVMRDSGYRRKLETAVLRRSETETSALAVLATEATAAEFSSDIWAIDSTLRESSVEALRCSRMASEMPMMASETISVALRMPSIEPLAELEA